MGRVLEGLNEWSGVVQLYRIVNTHSTQDRIEKTLSARFAA